MGTKSEKARRSPRRGAKGGARRLPLAQRIMSAALAVVFALGMSPATSLAQGAPGDGAPDVDLSLTTGVQDASDGDAGVDAGDPATSLSTDAPDGSANGPADAAAQDPAPAPQNGTDLPQDVADTLQGAAGNFLTLITQAPLYPDDPFYFKDFETGQIVTTLHTSGTYVLVQADGSPYLGSAYPYFEPLGSTARPNHDGGFQVYTKTATLDGETGCQVLEDLSSAYKAKDMMLPSGLYRIRISGNTVYGSYLRQRYQVVNDGVFCPQFESGSGSNYTANFCGISVKPYEEGKSDDDYDGYYYDEDNGGARTAITPDLDTFALAGDTRLRLAFESAMPIDKDTVVQIEGIDLWKADGTMADYRPLPEGATDDDESSYRNMNRLQISRIPDLGSIPSWPNYLNFNDDARIAHLWSREDGGLDARTVFVGDVADGAVDEGSFIVDHANFAGAVAESGVYFPIVKATIGEETYTFAYYPIQVDATGTVDRANPSITTTTLKNTRVAAEYTAQLKGRSGAKADAGSTFSWTVTAGALPDGLALNEETGALSGTPTEEGIFNFTVTLTETIGGDARTATRSFALHVGKAVTAATAFEHLSLGQIQYTPGTFWLNNHWNRLNYLDFTVPISLDVRDESLDLGDTEVWWLVQLTAEGDDDPVYYNEFDYAANLMGEDGTTLRIPILVKDSYTGRTKAIHRVRVFLVPKHNDGSYAFDLGAKENDGTYSDGEPFAVEDPGWTLAKRYMQRDMGDEPVIWTNGYGFSGDYAYYGHLPEMPYTALDSPAIDFGSWLHFPSLSFEGDEQPTAEGRIRIWRYNGTATPGADMQELEIAQPYGRWDDSDFTKEENGGATFKLAPGTYAFTAEGAVPVYDALGEAIEGEKAWVDIAGQVEGARAIRGTHPKQYLVTIGPNEGSIDEWDGWNRLTAGITYTGENIMAEDIHSATVTFEQEDGSYAEDPGAQYQVSWYRRTGEDSSTDVLVATGKHVSFGPSVYPLYVEVVPTGRTASFWKTSSRQLVPAKNKVTTVKVPRKQLFTGKFNLSCESGKVPNLGDYWGILEVKTPLEGGGYTTTNHWALNSPVNVPGITSGSTITFTPASNLEADAVSYTVPDEVQANFTHSLVAPMVKGTISFKGLSFTGVDGTTETISFDDGYTGLKVERLVLNSNGSVSHTVAVPHRQLDGSRIVLQPEKVYGEYYDYYLTREETYRITVTHRDPNAPARMGSNASEYAAKQAFDVTLSSSQTSATVEPATLTSRGYADISLANPGNKVCTLLLYDGEGNFVEKASANEAAQLRTPFLDAGSYELYAVDAGRLPDRSDYSNKNTLKDQFQRYYPDRISDPLTFTIENAKVTTPEGELILPNWTARELVDRAASSVTATASFSDKVTVTMHAELNEGVMLSNLDSARLEIQTNQRSNEYGQGFMNPEALNINGKAVALNRWSTLFNNTQNMSDGSLRIQIGEAAKINSACARFPMDMTLVIPRRNMDGVEASVWLVDGDTRSLVGTYREDTQEISLSAPPVVAWQSFYVSGETAPQADVALYVGGMRAASAKADEFGYYTAEITLPGALEDFDEFNIVAAAQWTRGDVGYAVTSETQTIIYSTTFPALERITLCYQSKPGSTYNNIVTYYRGAMPDKYATFYRAENEYNSGEDADHAKYFWIVEYANGGIIETVDISVPRSDGSSVQLTSTEKLQTAESWIPDAQMRISYANPTVTGGVAAPGSETGGLVRTALTSNALRSFVTMPEYFAYSPDALDTFIHLVDPETITRAMTGALDYGPFEEFKSEGITQDGLSDLLAKMSATGHIRICNDADADRLGLGAEVTNDSVTNAGTMAQSLINANQGSVGEWFLVSFGTEEVDGRLEDPLLKVHHTVTTENLTSSEFDEALSEVLGPAQAAASAYESWLYDGRIFSEAINYKGNEVLLAGSPRSTHDESYLYFIVTADVDNDMQTEMMKKYFIENSDGEQTGKYIYQHTYMDKNTMVHVSLDELHKQRVTVTYTIWEGQASTEPMHYVDISTLWGAINDSIASAFNEATFEILKPEDGTMLIGLSGQSLGGGLATQGDAANEGAAFIATDIITRALKKLFPRDTNEQNAAEKDKIRAKMNRDANPDVIGEPLDYMDIIRLSNIVKTDLQNTLEAPVVTTGITIGTGGANICTYVAALAGPGLSEAIARTEKDGDTSWIEREMYKKWFEDPELENGLIAQRAKQILYADFKKDKISACEGTGLLNYTHRWKNILGPKLHAEFERRFNIEQELLAKANSPQNEGVHDPSGIVYEAVLSNPVEGATVKLFTYNKAAGAFNLTVADDAPKLDEATFLDSTKFNIEENPQVTGADGRYQWFVPEGYWQVRVTKEGYKDFSTGDWGHEEEVPVLGEDYMPTGETRTVWVGDYGIDGTKTLYAGTADEIQASSYWMPVLPIQLDVNIPLVSLEAPTIESVEATNDGLIVTFTKYLQPETVTGSMFTVALGDGAAMPMGAVESLDAEEAGDGSGAVYARTFLVTASEGAAYPDALASRFEEGDNALTVTLADASSGALSYAGTPVSDEGPYPVMLDYTPPAVDLSEATIASIPAQTYTGKQLKPAVTVTYGGARLVAGKDYTVSYGANTNAGNGSVTITAIAGGGYKGTKSATFKIGPAAITSVTAPDQTYAAKALKPAPKVKAGSLTVPASGYTASYKNNVNAGTATVTVTGKGNFAGTKSATFKVLPADLAGASVAKVADQKFDGGAKKPSPKVSLGGKTLREGTDYALSYRNNVAAGTATLTVTGKGNYKGSKSATFKIVRAPATWKRLAGAVRYDTMAAIVAEGFPKSEWAVVATGANFPDALAASALAGARKCPVVLTEPGRLSPQAAAQLKRLGVKGAYVMGGEAAVSRAAEASIKAMGISVTRVSGASRTETSVEAMRQVRRAGSAADTLIVATGRGFADTLSIGPWSYRSASPIVLAGDDGRLTASEVAAIKADGRFSKAVIVGGTAVVSRDVESQLRSAGVGSVTRLAGADRYETSRKIAEWEAARGMSLAHPALATGRNFPDALAGAALSGSKGSVLVLADSAADPGVSLLSSRRAEVASGYFLGGEAVVTPPLATAVQNATK